jgi:hypothetical protein
MNAFQALLTLNSLRAQILAVDGKSDFDTAAVLRHLRGAIDSIEHERGSAIEGDFDTQGGGGFPE